MMRKSILFLLLFVASTVFGVDANSVWRVPNGGNVGAWGPVNLADNTNAITGTLDRNNLPLVGQVFSISSGAVSTSSTSFSAIAATFLSITTGGRPVFVGMQPDGSNPGYLQSTGSIGEVAIYRDGSAIGVSALYFAAGLASQTGFSLIDVVGSGTHTYQIYFRNTTGGGTTSVVNMKLFAYEL